MKYNRNDAKDYARENMRGIWAAALNPFAADGSLNETGLRANIRHWVDDLEIQGLFIAGKQGEFFSMSLDERKRNFEIAVDETGDKAKNHHVLFGPELRYGRGACPACGECRRGLHRGARPCFAFCQ